MRARQLSFRLASRAGDGSDPAISHLCLLPALPNKRAWAPLSWTGRLTPGVSVAWVPATVPGRTGWVRLHKGTNRIPRLFFRIRLLPSKPLRPFAFEPPRPLLNTVRRLLGWSPQDTAWGIRAGSVSLGDLRVGEFVLFISHISTGLGLPISSFFLLLLEDFGLQLQHLTPHSILLTSIFVHLCEMFVGVRPCIILFRHFFVLVKSGKGKDEVGAYYFQTRSDLRTPYIPGLTGGKLEDWRKE